MSIEPFAYGIQAPIGSVTTLFHKLKDAEDYIAKFKLTDSRDAAKIIPLYRASPTVETMLECWHKTIARDDAQEEEIARLRLTDAEREAVERAAQWMVQLVRQRAAEIALQIGDITGVAKKGHEYLWVRYEDSVSGSELGKLERIRNEVLKQMSSHKRGSEGFFLSQDKYNDFLDSCGILRVYYPHWITESKNPAETENSIIIPNPTFDYPVEWLVARGGHSLDDLGGHSLDDLGLCIPEEVALKILTLGIP